MATFQVPQFIEQKAKIVGPLTLPQFLYLAGAGGISLFAFYTFTFSLWLFITIVAGACGLALAFVKINGRGLPRALLSALFFLWRPRVYTWQRTAPRTAAFDVSALDRISEARERASFGAKLKDLVIAATTRKPPSPRGGRERTGEDHYQRLRSLTGETEVARRMDYT